jgi:hypothetical protein
MYDFKLSIWPALLKSASNFLAIYVGFIEKKQSLPVGTKLEDVQELLFKLLWINVQISSVVWVLDV